MRANPWSRLVTSRHSGPRAWFRGERPQNVSFGSRQPARLIGEEFPGDRQRDRFGGDFVTAAAAFNQSIVATAPTRTRN
jgi:hypothetical protein